MSDMAFAMTVCEPRRVSSDSFWVDAPREHFTDLCRERAFQHLPRARTDATARALTSTLPERS